MNAHGGHFPAIHPDPGRARLQRSANPEVVENIHHHLLKRPQVCHHVALPFSQIENRVADNLARSVIRDVAPAVGMVQRYPGAIKHLGAGYDVFDMTIATHGDHVGMLHDQKLVRDGARLARGFQIPLNG